MPEGEWAFLDSKGPRAKIALRISPQADALLRVRAAEIGTTKHALATQLIESYVQAELTKTGEPT